MVEVTERNAREAAAAAMRLLSDPFLAETLNEMIGMATERAITGQSRAERRDARHEVLAITALRTNLQAVFEGWQSAAEILERAREHE